MAAAVRLELREQVLVPRVERPGLKGWLENPDRLVPRHDRPEIAARGALPSLPSHPEFESRRATPRRAPATAPLHRPPTSSLPSAFRKTAGRVEAFRKIDLDLNLRGATWHRLIRYSPSHPARVCPPTPDPHPRRRDGTTAQPNSADSQPRARSGEASALRGLEQACDGAENTLRCACNGWVPTACTEEAAAREERF